MSDEIVRKLIELTEKDELRWDENLVAERDGIKLELMASFMKWELYSGDTRLSTHDTLLSKLRQVIDVQFSRRFLEGKKEIEAAILSW